MPVDYALRALAVRGPERAGFLVRHGCATICTCPRRAGACVCCDRCFRHGVDNREGAISDIFRLHLLSPLTVVRRVSPGLVWGRFGRSVSDSPPEVSDRRAVVMFSVQGTWGQRVTPSSGRSAPCPALIRLGSRPSPLIGVGLPRLIREACAHRAGIYLAAFGVPRGCRLPSA